MLRINHNFNKLSLAALALVFTGILNIPKVGGETIKNTTQLPGSGIITAVPEWKEFSSDDGKFSVLFPNENVFEMSPPKESFVPGIQSFKIHTASNEKSAFMVGYTDFSLDISQLPTEGLLDAFLQGLLQEKGKLLSRTNIQLGQYQGKEVKFRDEEQGMTYNTRVFLVEQKIYFLMVVSSQTPQVSDIQKFFNSFQLVERSPNQELPK
ncbi:MAG: hypothetical protein SAK29_02035 [Scytonema sp. PMC 1069.18]|nr:hypothetical protein [Scytonema sp. PMC 1069.18]MEC4885284.1 hypothetical protein [Scytonema sp. PMC 1070.18]